MAGIAWLRSHARVAVPAIVVATALLTLLLGVWHPDRIFFDETYYVNDARDFLEFGAETSYVVHPPLGKMIMAASIALFGDSPFGWRAVGALLGVVCVGLVYAIARRLGLRVATSGLAALALALDGIWIAQSRTGMLDIHLAFFVVLGFWALVRDRDVVRKADDVALDEARPRVDAPVNVPDEPEVATYIHTQDVAPDDDQAPPPPPPTTPPARSLPAARSPGELLAVINAGQGATADPADPAVQPPPPSEVPDPPAPPTGGPATASPAPPPAPVLDDAGAVDPDHRRGVAPQRVDWTVDRLPRPHRWWLLLAGLAFGASVAVKWSGAVALLAASVVWLGWELGRRRRLRHDIRVEPGRWIWLGVSRLGILAVVVYAVSWTPWFIAFDQTYMGNQCATADLDYDCAGFGRVEALKDFHVRIYDFHRELDADHNYRAPAIGWPIQQRPVVYYYETCSDDRANRVEETDSDGVVSTPEPCTVEQGQAAEIMSLGNPVTWWGLLALLPLLGAALRRREYATWAVLTMVVTQYGFWLIQDRPVFNFYTVPILPFLVLALAIAVDQVASRRDGWITMLGGLGTAGLVAGGTWLAQSRDLLAVSWPRTLYVVGLAAVVGGLATAHVLARRDEDEEWPPTEPTATTSPGLARIWPVVTVAVLLVGVAIFFLPVWTGLAMPSWFIRAHWWLPGWI